MTKAPTAFRTISEVAGELDLPQHVLRFWETKFSQLKPMKRGGRRRYYRPEDVALLRCIRGLLYDDGYTIKGVQKLLRQDNIGKFSTHTVEAPDPATPKIISAAVKGVNNKEAQRAISGAITDLENVRDLLRNT